MNARRCIAAGALVAAVLVAPLTPRAGADDYFGFNRLAGADRYATAATVARAVEGAGARALVATGESFPDALAASFLAGARSAPILLTAAGTLPPSTSAALDALGTTSVTLLGGTGAISQGVADELTAAGYAVDRIAGGDRYATARLVADAARSAVGTVDGKRTAVIASGESFADATAAGPLAYEAGLPILLTTPGSLAGPAAAALDSLDIEHALVLGGTAAVATRVENELAASGIGVTRLAGADRSATAAKIADYALSSLNFPATSVNLARGDAFADALAGGPYGGSTRAVTLLTASSTSLGNATAAWLSNHADTLTAGAIFGGQGAVSDDVEAAATAAARGAPVGAAGGADGPPLAITSGLADGGWTADTTPTYAGTAGSAERSVARVLVAIDDRTPSELGVTCEGCGDGDATWEYTPPSAIAEGAHTIEIQAVDARGVTSTVGTGLTVDTTAPRFDSVVASRGSNFVTAQFDEPMWCASASPPDFTAAIGSTPVTITELRCASDAAAVIDVVIGRGLAAGETVSVSIVGTVTDRAGNPSARSAQSTTVPNNDAPVTTITSGPANGAHVRTPTPTYGGAATAVAGRQVTRIEARIDSGAWSKVTCDACPVQSPSFTYAPAAALADGTYLIELRAIDDIGVSSTPISRTVTIDSLKPVFSQHVPTAASPVVVAVFTEANGIDCATVEASDFTATIEGVAIAVASAACQSGSATLVDVTLEAAPDAGEEVALTLRPTGVGDRVPNWADGKTLKVDA